MAATEAVEAVPPSIMPAEEVAAIGDEITLLLIFAGAMLFLLKFVILLFCLELDGKLVGSPAPTVFVLAKLGFDRTKD